MEVARRQSTPKFSEKYFLKYVRYAAVFFSSKDNANTACRFFSNLADSLLQNFHVQKTSLESNLLKNQFAIKHRIIFKWIVVPFLIRI